MPVTEQGFSILNAEVDDASDVAAVFYNNIAVKWDVMLARPMISTVRDTEASLTGEILACLKNSPVLEIGVGTADLSVRLKNQGYPMSKDWYGIDISANMLDIAAQKHNKLVQADGLFLPFARNSFGVCITHHFLSLLSDESLIGMCEQIDQALKPGGIFVATLITQRDESSDAIFQKPYPQPKDSHLRQVSERLDYRRSAAFYTQLLVEQGYAQIQVQPITHDSIHFSARKPFTLPSASV